MNNEALICDPLEVDWYMFNSDHGASFTFLTCSLRAQGIGNSDVSFSRFNNASLQFITIKHQPLVKYLPANIAQSFPTLRGIEISDCPIKLLMPRSFKNLKSLEELSMPETEIEFVGRETFDDLINLKYLVLSHNHIEYINPGAFRHLTKLENLILHKNKLRYLDDNIFANLRNLKSLSLKHNNIEEISRNLFRSNLNLRHVWLEENKIKIINQNAFDGLSNLNFINLSKNRCINILFHKETLSKVSERLNRSSCKKINPECQVQVSCIKEVV